MTVSVIKLSEMRYLVLFLFVPVVVSCGTKQLELPNERKGAQKAVMELSYLETKAFVLDSTTAPHPYYMQMFLDSSGVRQFTFLNHYRNSILFYNYDNLSFIKEIQFIQEGSEAVERPRGYYIKSIDSIYIFSGMMHIMLVNSKGKVLNKVSLIGEYDMSTSPRQWAYKFPYYLMQTSKPFMQTKTELILSGSFTGSIPDSLVNKFKFTAHIDFNMDSVYFSHTYPSAVFGNNNNWGGSIPMEVFPLLHPDGRRIIYSFVPSHHLYISDLQGTQEYKITYAGSNFAGTISSYKKDAKRMKDQTVVSKFVREDRYCAIHYDPFRKVYYRFIREAMTDAPIGTHWNEKNISVIILDEDMRYLGETTLGPCNVWYWQNSFVSEEGLNIEYIDKNDEREDYLNLGLFVPKEI